MGAYDAFICPVVWLFAAASHCIDVSPAVVMTRKLYTCLVTFSFAECTSRSKPRIAMTLGYPFNLKVSTRFVDLDKSSDRERMKLMYPFAVAKARALEAYELPSIKEIAVTAPNPTYFSYCSWESTAADFAADFDSPLASEAADLFLFNSGDEFYEVLSDFLFGVAGERCAL